MTEIDLGKRVLDYFHKIKTSEVMWCEDHDRELLEDEKCPGCERECEHNYERYGSEMLDKYKVIWYQCLACGKELMSLRLGITSLGDRLTP